jgi:DNA modification methylase
VSGSVRNRILVGDVRERLAELPDAAVDCIITSPPYFQLRDYGSGAQIGHEATIDGWVDELRLTMNGLRRVLKPSGSLWLNLGDSYSRRLSYGAAPKSLLLGPERLLIALSEDGWIVRNKVIWAKTRHLPSSVADRLTNSYEVVFFLTREPRYFFDLDAIRQPHRTIDPHPRRQTADAHSRPAAGRWAMNKDGPGLATLKARGLSGHPLGRNPGDVWSLATSEFRGAHFATFPSRLVTPPLLATCPELVCDHCGTPFRRHHAHKDSPRTRRPALERRPFRGRPERKPTRQAPLLPQCGCHASASPGVVLDPFFGSGTVAVVAEQHGRDWLGIELNPTYARLAEQRLAAERARRTADGPPADESTAKLAPADKPSNPERGHLP